MKISNCYWHIEAHDCLLDTSNTSITITVLQNKLNKAKIFIFDLNKKLHKYPDILLEHKYLERVCVSHVTWKCHSG